MNKEKRKVPKLRFPDCNRLWEEYRLADLLVERSVLCTQSEKYPLVSFTVESGVTPKTERYDREALVVGNKASKKYKMTLVDDIVYNPANLKFGAIARNKYGNAVFSPIYVTLEVQTNRVFPKFIEYILTSKCFINRALRYQQGTVYERQSVNVESLLLQTVNIPVKDEQIKISDLLYKFDQLLGLYQHKLKMLLLKKKALLQKLFPKAGARYPELRFPGFTDAWEQRKLSDISTKVTTKNVDVHYTETLTNSAEQGIISQVDFFDKEISNKDNINGYYIVENNDFIYNPRISTLAPVGPINRNKLNRTGIMSPLYTIFRGSNVDLGFLEWYFQSNHWHRYMKINGDSGARADRIAIKDSTFFEMPIKTPVNLKEQVLIGETLEKFNQYITLHQRKLDHLQLQKKALLQQMFV